MYNLTAHFSLNKKAYNAVWSEIDGGRGGNEIASAMLCILFDLMKDYPDMKSLCLWSDSCVPQNRNSIMLTALKHFMTLNPNVEEIVQKFCTPGHSSIQEVDNVHSHIEKALIKNK